VRFCMVRKASKFRVKTFSAFPLDGLCLSRRAAIERVQEQLGMDGFQQEALRLIELFNIDAEELAEAGLAYEQLKALDRQLLFR
jgi:hypothetical protein